MSAGGFVPLFSEAVQPPSTSDELRVRCESRPLLHRIAQTDVIDTPARHGRIIGKSHPLFRSSRKAYSVGEDATNLRLAPSNMSASTSAPQTRSVPRTTSVCQRAHGAHQVRWRLPKDCVLTTTGQIEWNPPQPGVELDRAVTGLIRTCVTHRTKRSSLAPRFARKDMQIGPFFAGVGTGHCFAVNRRRVAGSSLPH